jgi:lipoprotein signal peptidase
MNIDFGVVRTGVFNVADMAIVAGSVLLLVLLLRPERPGA